MCLWVGERVCLFFRGRVELPTLLAAAHAVCGEAECLSVGKRECLSVSMKVCLFVAERVCLVVRERVYGLATISRLLKIIRLFCRILSLYRALLQQKPLISRSLLVVATP